MSTISFNPQLNVWIGKVELDWERLCTEDASGSDKDKFCPLWENICQTQFICLVHCKMVISFIDKPCTGLCNNT